MALIFGKADYKSLQAANDSVSLKGKIGAILGGTGGIGKPLAAKLLSLGASVVVVGRNEAAVADLKPAAEGAFMRFVKCDASLMANVKAAVADIQAMPEVAEHGLDYVAACCGALPDSYTLTSEGLELFTAVVLFGRLIFITLLAPQLAKAHGAALDIHRGGMDASSTAPLNLDDLGSLAALHKAGKYSFFTATAAASVATDGVLKELAAKHAEANVRFAHIMPGVVPTEGLLKLGGRMIKLAISVAGSLILTGTPEQTAEMLVSVLLKPAPQAGSTFVVYSNKGLPATEAGWIRKNPDAARKTYEAFATIAGL